jgi:leucyl/phenylalanyl-tRNA--protein transferase
VHIAPDRGKTARQQSVKPPLVLPWDKTQEIPRLERDKVPDLAYFADRMTDAAPGDRRSQLFREPPFAMLERFLLGAAWAMKPQRIGGLPGVASVLAHDLLVRNRELPDPENALTSPPGLAGVVHSLSVDTLVAAYGRGLYPFSHLPPLKWWSPPTRSVLLFKDHHIGKTLRSKLKQARYKVTFDRAFEQVIAACAGRRTGRWHLTWITPRIMRAYTDLFDAGYAHSFEVWNETGDLVAGGYGVAIGGSFSGESQFSIERDTSKIGLSTLHFHLARWGYHFDDGKIITPTTQAFGFQEMPRADYLKRLAQAVRAHGKSGRWQAEADLPDVAAWKPSKA